MGKTVLITGASSGFGLLTSITLAKRGWHVIATMRDLSRRQMLEATANEAGVLERIEVHLLDVTNAGQIAALAGRVEERKAPLHAVVNNAGFVMAGFTEDVNDEELRSQFETNFFGTVAVTKAFLPQLKRQGFGHIVMLSSILGRVGFPGTGSYCASKFALEGWSETLRMELKPRGIQVVLIEPGAFDTDIWSRNAQVSKATAMHQANAESPDAKRIERWRQKREGRQHRANPKYVAECIANVLSNPRPGLRYSLGTDAWGAMLARTLLPWGTFENAIIKASGAGD